METAISDITGFADAGDSRDKVIVDTITNVATTVDGDANVSIEFLGDFGEVNGAYPDEWFSVSIEGYSLGQFQGYQSVYTATSATISKADWAAIIADGNIVVTYTMGPEVDNNDTNPNEFVRLTFTWDKPPIVYDPPTEPNPEIFNGTSGNDWLPGTVHRDIIKAGAGDDTVYARDGNDTVWGGAGNDVIGGGGGNDVLRGGDGKDLIFGGSGNDSLYGGTGNDVLWGGANDDLLNGDSGNDLLGGGNGRDQLHGGSGNDQMFGGGGDDRLFGDSGNDALYGGAGSDILDGGFGNDTLFGGSGADTFIFGESEGKDVIHGFDAAGGDRIDLEGQTYTISANDKGFAVLELSGGGTIVLDGIASGDVNDGWFLAA